MWRVSQGEWKLNNGSILIDDRNILSYDIDGYSVQVGRNASSNERLVSQHKLSHPLCLWLHALGATGSHVILCLQGRQSVPYETFRKVAKVALENSRSRGQSVRFAKLETVFKPEGASDGVWQSKPYEIFEI
jgi:predicted ribosome quality control (RQC) complex YloA/Tae2 family protein